MVIILYGDNNQFDDTGYYRLNDICFATEDIYSYCNTANYSNNSLSYYDIFKSTIIRKSSKYKLNNYNDSYLINFLNNEDTSSLLPSGTNSQFLNSPVFTYNPTTQTGGYFIAQVEDIITGDRVINYNNEYSPVNNTYNENILDTYDITQVIHTFNQDYINATDTTNDILNHILIAIYSLDDKLEYIGDNIGSSVSNVTNVTNNYFKPDRLKIKQQQELLDDTFAQHLGFIYDIPSTLVYAIGIMVDSTQFENIQITIPSVTIFDYQLINEYTYSFTDLFENNSTFNTIHETILIMTDTIMLCLLLALGKKCYEKVVEK